MNNQSEKKIIVNGIGGLGNCLFQIASALYYSEKYEYKIYLNENSYNLHYGTSNYTNRKQCKVINNIDVSYKNTIYKNLNYINCDEFNINGKIIHNDYSDIKIIPNDDDINLVISGYCQNINLFSEVRNNIINYLNICDNETIHYLKNKYNFDENEKNIMLGIRISDDFAHMTKINNNSYKNALYTLVDENESNFNLIIVADKPEKYKEIINFNINGKVIVIDSDDIEQFNVGFLCNHFILSESTYHYWIAYLKTSIDNNTKVVCFNDTDITNRNLEMDDWIKINY
jgi:hypothetical protein